jgi:TolA-binding protein
MHKGIQIVLTAVVAASVLQGCYIERESTRPRDDYFQPVINLPQRNRQNLSSAEMEELKNQLKAAASAAVQLRDSLVSLRSYAGSLLSSTRDLVEKVSELEAREFLAVKKQKEFETNIAELKSDNRLLSEKVNELQVKFVSMKIPAGNSEKIYIHEGNEYDSGLLLFYRHRYSEAREIFEGLLKKGIQKDLADNCEYWMGECSYAQKRYADAATQFKRVLSITTSNKHKDAFFMLGKSFEGSNNPLLAKQVYEELNRRFPLNEHSRAVKARLEMLKRKLNQLNKNKGTKPLI